jgi:hypothetical protein
MKRTTLVTLAAALLALSACSSTTAPVANTEQRPHEPEPTTITLSSVAKAKAVSSPKAASPSDCPDRPDIYLWMRTDGVPDSAQRLGGTTITTCEPSYKMLMAAAPTTPGSCTEIAQVSDNPGYDENATPAKRLKKVEYSVGPAC